MPNLPTSVVTQVAALALLLAVAVGTDIRSRRIPNLLVLTGITIALGIHFAWIITGQTTFAGPDWWSTLAGLATGFALFLPLYLLRAMGAGDVKLMAMVGAFVGPSSVLTVALYTLAAGGLLAILLMLVRGVAAQTLSNLRFMLNSLAIRVSTGQGGRPEPLKNTAAHIPYALAIAIGTGAALLLSLRI